MRTITGKDGTGRYYIVDEISGLSLPSVTTILSTTSDKSELQNWISQVGQEEADRISKFSANRGTFMHSLHEHYLNVKFIENRSDCLKEAFRRAKEECSNLSADELECGKNLFFNFHRETNFYERIEKVLFQEIPVWSLKGGGYAGRLDLAIKSSGVPILIDFKTSRKPKKREWIGNYFKQAAAYSIAMWERYGIFPDQCEIWISCETGDVQTFVITKDEIKHWFGEFYKDVLKYHELHINN